jgi:hypothetical protein
VIGRHVVARLDGAAPAAGEERFGLDHPRSPQATPRTGADGMVDGWADW